MAEIIQIDSLKLKRASVDLCHHKNMTYDPIEEYIGCSDCGRQLTPFKAFMIMVGCYSREIQRLETRTAELKMLEEKADRNLLKATRTVDRAWRNKSMLPCCPHCGQGIAPEDGLGNGHSINRQMEMERRKFKKKE